MRKNFQFDTEERFRDLRIFFRWRTTHYKRETPPYPSSNLIENNGFKNRIAKKYVIMRIKSIAKSMTFPLMNSRKKCIKLVSLFKYLVIFSSFSSNKQKRQSYTKIHLSNALRFIFWRFDEIFVALCLERIW